MASFADLPTEMKTEVFGYLADDWKSLNSFIRVDRAWHRHAIVLLWRHASTENLISITSVSRRQVYADMLCRLTISSATQAMVLNSMVYTNLTEVTLGQEATDRVTPFFIRLRPFLPSTLRKIEIREYYLYTTNVLDLISVCCPSLQDLRLASSPYDLERTGDLNDLVLNFPALRHLELGLYCHKLSRRGIELLGQTLPMLETLRLLSHYDPQEWDGTSRAVFPRLKSLVLEHVPYSTYIRDWKKLMIDEHLKILLRLAPGLKTYRINQTRLGEPTEVKI